MIVLNIFTVLLVVNLILCIYILLRNEKVSRFRTELIDMADEGCERILKDLNNKDYLLPFMIYDSVSYDRMLFSFKPLKIEYWYTEEQIRQMRGEDGQSE